MDNIFYSQGKLREYADAFRRLTGLFEGDAGNAMVLQFRETAAMLERISGEGQAQCLLDDEQKRMLYSYLKSEAVIVGGILALEPVPGRLELILRLSTKRGCVTARKLAMGVGDILHRRLKVAGTSRQVITKEQGEFIFEEMTDYRLLFGQACCNQGFSRVSGDNFSFISVEGGRSILSLADGMGCGSEANEYSTRFIELLEQLLEAGFSEEASIEMLNDVFAANDTMGRAVTLDMCSINEYEGRADFWKMGAMPSFIKGREGVSVVDSSSLPAGVLDSPLVDHKSITLNDGDYIIMMSDGVLDALPFYDKEKRMKEIIEDVQECMPQAIAERILNEVYFYDEKIADDMTVLVAGVWKNRTDS